jgi:hypothetical protein
VLSNSKEKPKLSGLLFKRWRIIYPLKFSAMLYLKMVEVKIPQIKKQSTSKS